MRRCCTHLSDTERLQALDGEVERGKEMILVTENFDTLKEEFPITYLDIATVLIRKNIPVFRITREVNRVHRIRTVQKVSASDIENLRQQQSTNDAKECSTSSGVSNVVPVTRFMVTDPVSDDDDYESGEESVNQSAAVKRMLDAKSKDGGEGKGKGKGKKTLKTPFSSSKAVSTTNTEDSVNRPKLPSGDDQQHQTGGSIVEEINEIDGSSTTHSSDTKLTEIAERRTSAESVFSNVSDDIRPVGKRRVAVHSDEEDTETTNKRRKDSNSHSEHSSKRQNSFEHSKKHQYSSKTQTEHSKKLQSMNEKLSEYNILVSPEETAKFVTENAYLRKLKTHMESSMTENQKKNKSEKRSVHVKKTVSNSIRVMRYLAPGNKIPEFTWSCLADADKLKQFFINLREIGMASRTIANYQKALNKLFTVAIADVDFRLTQPEIYAHVTALSVTFAEIKKGINKTINEEQMEKRITEAYTDISVYEEKFINIFQNLENLRKVAEPIIMRAKDGPVNLSDSDLFIVNGFFNLYSTLAAGNRPGVFQNMTLDVFQMADNCRQTREDGSTYYFMATADHKTGATDLAYIYIDEKDWELFRIYKSNIRKPPVKTDERYLFVNKHGRRISNPSGDIKILTKRYGTEMTCNDARHTIETMGKHHCTKEEQAVIHQMLTHSVEAAQRHYMEPHAASLPHRKGIPLLEGLLRKLSDKHHIAINSPLSGCMDLRAQVDKPTNSDVASASSTGMAELIDAPARSASPASSVSSCEHSGSSSDRTEGFKTLLQRAFPGMHSDLPLPGHSAVRNAIKDNPDLKLINEKKTWSSFVEHCRYQRILARADECANYYRRTKVLDIESTVSDFVTKRRWAKEDKLLRKCAQKLEIVQKTHENSKRILSNEKTDVAKQIEEQNWPLLAIRTCSGIKGKGIFATENINKGTLLCDYHGTLISDEEGWRRYKEYGNSTENVYMFQFDSNSGKKMWIDANQQCSCHPDKKLKGRLINCKRKNPNVLAKVVVVQEKEHILFYAREDIVKHSELNFNYGAYKDPHSAQEEWMK